jgi:hypothetical protein
MKSKLQKDIDSYVRKYAKKHNITKEYKDIMEYCYLNNITLFEVKANGN